MRKPRSFTPAEYGAWSKKHPSVKRKRHAFERDVIGLHKHKRDVVFGDVPMADFIVDWHKAKLVSGPLMELGNG